MHQPHIIFEDNHILLVNKPAGIATQPCPTSDESLEKLCKNWIKIRDQKPGNVFLQPIHRIDKPVSGLVLFAKTSKALSRLNESMRARQMQKVYLARVEGLVLPTEGRLVHYMTHGDHYAHIVSEGSPLAKRAVLNYCLKQQDKDSALLEIHLETGRYHQIRAQMAAIGHPILGDLKYGSKRTMPKGTIDLCHQRFSFPHPITKEMLTFSL